MKGVGKKPACKHAQPVKNPEKVPTNRKGAVVVVENTPKFVVYSPAVARRLQQKGYPKPLPVDSDKKKFLQVFLFDDSPELRADVKRIGDEIKRSRAGRNNKEKEHCHEQI